MRRTITLPCLLLALCAGWHQAAAQDVAQATQQLNNAKSQLSAQQAKIGSLSNELSATKRELDEQKDVAADAAADAQAAAERLAAFRMPTFLAEVGLSFSPPSWYLGADQNYLLDFPKDTNPVLYTPHIVAY